MTSNIGERSGKGKSIVEITILTNSVSRRRLWSTVFNTAEINKIRIGKVLISFGNIEVSDDRHLLYNKSLMTYL